MNDFFSSHDFNVTKWRAKAYKKKHTTLDLSFWFFFIDR